jgi:hypothetical protein
MDGILMLSEGSMPYVTPLPGAPLPLGDLRSLAFRPLGISGGGIIPCEFA